VNRILALIVGVAMVALVVFGVIVFTSGPKAPVLSSAGQPAESAAADSSAVASAVPEIPEAAQQTSEATERFDAWAKPLRDDGLTVTADRVSTAGETVSVAGLTIKGPEETPGWRWTAERASLYDRELFHLQTAGKMDFVLTTEGGQETVWSGRADALGIAMKRDVRDALSRSVVVRANGLSLARAGEAPFTLGDGQLRILLKGGTGLLTPGTDIVLRLTDLNLPAAAGAALGTKLDSFTTEFGIDRSITDYSLQQVIDFFTRGNRGDVDLGTIAMDWGTLHFIGKGSFGLDAGGEPRGRFEVRLTDALTLLDAIAAAGGAAVDALADDYAELLLELGRSPDETALPAVIAIKNGAMVLEGAAGDVKLEALPKASNSATEPAAPAR
jgi:hypothetical protein